VVFSPFEWLVAGRYLRSRRREGFVSVIAVISFIGISLGVATLIIVMAVMNGFRIDLLSRILGVNGHAVVEGGSGPLRDFDAIAARITRVGGVVRVSPIVEGQVMATGREGAASGALVRGVRADYLTDHSILSSHIVEGSLASFAQEGGVVLGARLASRLGLMVGDSVPLLAPRGVATPFGTAPRVLSYPVVALFQVGMSEYDGAFIFMPLDAAQQYFRMGDGVSGLEIILADPEQAPGLRGALGQAAGPGTRLRDWQQMNSSFFSALQVERNVMFMILTLIILVAALNMISGLIMLVKDKGHDIAILRTMGASGGAVMRIFFICGASIGVTGALAGVLMGTVFCANIEAIRQFLSRLTGTVLFSPEVYFLSQMPAHMDPAEVGAVIVMALTLSMLATLYPAWRAAKLDPVEALRYE
jgi:lipoprotein-releasing system permease protein